VNFLKRGEVPDGDENVEVAIDTSDNHDSKSISDDEDLKIEEV